MTKTAHSRSASYRCADCGWTCMQWVGRCGECHAWGTVEQLGAATRFSPGPATRPALPIRDVEAEAAVSRSSGVSELDRVLGGGIVPGAVLLLAGEPGVGKSTLLLEVAAQVGRRGAKTLYVSGEESASQVRLRAERTGALEQQLYLAAETDLAAVLGHIDSVDPDLLVIDSIQTMVCRDVDGVAGGVTQVRAVTTALVTEAKSRHLPTLLVGHVTKDGSIAGPRALEHIVDVVLHFEGERNSRLRVLRAVKNRFGPVDEIGCFDLCDDGIVEVADASGLFISRHLVPTSGTCVTVTLEGRRPLITEVQSLVTVKEGPHPRRAVSGIDSSRLAMLIAVLQRHVGLDLTMRDVYAATVGGALLRTPAADLAIAAALASTALDRVVPAQTVTIGEVGLAGELRRVPNLSQRVSEAARLGFTSAVVPADHGPAPTRSPPAAGLTVIECDDLRSALAALGLVAGGPTRVRPGLQMVR